MFMQIVMLWILIELAAPSWCYVLLSVAAVLNFLKVLVAWSGK